MAQVIQTNGAMRQVKNLGWLLRNWRAVERLEWTGSLDSGIFRAHLADGRTYETRYASFEVWKGFINRPVFRGRPVTVNGITGRI